MHKGTLRVQKIEFVVEAAPCTRDSSRVGKHAQTAGDLCQITTRDVRRGLIADTELEASRAPVDELDGSLGLDEADGGVRVLGHDITTVEQSTGHWA